MKFSSLFLMLSVLCISNTVFAATTLRGVDRISRQPCTLNVLNVYEEGAGTPEERLRAEVQTSYAHDGEAPPTFVLKFTEPGVLTGSDAAGENTLRVTMPAGSTDLRTARAYRLRWLHGDHFHDSVCLQLVAQ